MSPALYPPIPPEGAEAWPAPAWIDDADIDFNEMIAATGINRNTLTSYQRLLIASGRRCGRKARGLWFFSTRELYAIKMISALARGRIPISIEILLSVWDFAEQPPAGHFVLPTNGDGAVTNVKAVFIWNAVIAFMTGVRAHEEADNV